MVQKIISLIEHHSQDSKGTKKLFSTLTSCNSFLGTLKIIESFVMTSKVLVPSRYVMLPTLKSVASGSKK